MEIQYIGQAVRLYIRAAEQGHSAAQYEIADRYEHGRELEKDYAEALKWYRKCYT
ncbi:hypothetical protein [Clostridium sp.]|uniref:hypothetical protein n=1 Tax=Clostridium sp. TaxID=1506 RepID=UPI003D6C7283